MTGQVVILNGAPRAGKSSIAAAMGDGWLSLGVDAWMKTTPPHMLPGIGLRPGGERPDLEDYVVEFYAALYDAIAGHARAGHGIVADTGHHDAYSRPLGILNNCARRLAGLPVLFVGVRCPLDVIMQRRGQSDGRYVKSSVADPVPAPVQSWQDAVHAHGLYDLDVNTAVLTPEQCAEVIRRKLLETPPSPSAFERLAAN